MKLLILGSFFFSAAVALAAPRGGNSNNDNFVTGILGFTQSAVNFGANYEHRFDSFGAGGYFLYSGEEKDNGLGKNQTISFGANLPIHIFEDSRFDVSLAPGFGITQVKGISPQNDETIFGPSIKTGLFYKLTPTVKAGIDHSYFTNWFNDKTNSAVEYTNAAVSFTF